MLVEAQSASSTDHPMLRNSCLCTTYPTFSSLPIEHPISLSTNSSLHQTDFKICPHLSSTPHSPRRNSVPIIDTSSCFTFLVFDPLRSSTGPSVRWSPFSSSYVFPFRFRSHSAFATLYRFPIPIPLSTSYNSLPPFADWFSDVVAYPEPYLKLRFSLHSVLYKVTRPLIYSLASSTQFSLVSSLPRFALRTTVSKSSFTRNDSLRTL